MYMLTQDIVTNNRSEKTALLFEAETLSYEDLDKLSNQFAHFFQARGISKGDRVSFISPNDSMLVAGYFGAFKAGAIANPINNRLTPAELAYILNHAESKCIVISADFIEVLTNTLGLLKHQPEILVIRAPEIVGIDAYHDRDIQHSSTDALAIAGLSPEDGALLLYTSGTTGKPKGVLLTHANLCHAAKIVSAGFDIQESDRTLCVMPLFHTNGLMFSNLPFLYRGASIALRKRFSASKFWSECKEYAVNSSSVSPTILSLLLEHEKQAPPASEITLKYIKVASAPTSKELAQRFENRFGKNLLLETFGLTETTAINTMNPLRGIRKFGSIGQVLDPQKVMIADENGNSLAANEIGELLIQSDLIMKEYYLDPINTANTVKNGWLHSGDFAKIDEEGFVFIVGRKKEMIIRGGENISPLEVEQVAALHPDVLEAAAVGLPDQIWGETVGLVVVSSKVLSAEAIIGFCRERLSPFKVPENVVFSDKLPRNAMGKVMRNALRAAFLISEVQSHE